MFEAWYLLKAKPRERLPPEVEFFFSFAVSLAHVIAANLAYVNCFARLLDILMDAKQIWLFAMALLMVC